MGRGEEERERMCGKRVLRWRQAAERVRGNTGVTEFGMDNAGSIAVRITLAPSGHRGGGGEKNWGTGRREDFERVWGERECSDAVEVGKGRVVRRWTQSGSHSIGLMHVMRIRRALKKLSFVKSEHRVRGEKWEKDCGGGDITGRQNLTRNALRFGTQGHG